MLESLQRDTTIEEVCRKFDIPSSVVNRWRQEFQQNGPEVFADKRNPKTRVQGYALGESLGISDRVLRRHRRQFRLLADLRYGLLLFSARSLRRPVGTN